MKPNHLLTRLRQDIRKMETATSREVFLRFVHFAKLKMRTLQRQMHEGRLTEAARHAFLEALKVFVEVQKRKG